MKIAITLLVVALMCFQGSSAFLVGANVAVVEIKDLNSAINKCSTSAQKLVPTVCDIVKTMLKFESDGYKEAANSLTDVQFLIGDLAGLYSSILVCLNDQQETSTAENAARIVGNLIFQIDVHILPGITKISEAGKSCGKVLGEKLEKIMVTISEQLSEEFSTVKSSLEVIQQNLIDMESSAITAETLKTDLNSTVITIMTNSFLDILFTTEQLNTVTKSVLSITKTLGVVANSADKVEIVSIESITKATYQLDISIQASKKLLEKTTAESEVALTQSFLEVDSLLSKYFSGDKEFQESRDSIEDFVISLRGVMTTTSETLINSFSEIFLQMTVEITSMKETVAMMTDKIKEYMAEVVSMNSGSFVKCFGPTTNITVNTLQLIKVMGSNSSQCVTKQQSTTLKSQSLIKFIYEDVILNTKGAADKLCGCSVKGGKKDNEKSKKCIKKMTDEMQSTLLGEEKMYIESELEIMQSNLTMSTETFKMCTQNVTLAFEENFEKLKTEISACMAV